MNKLTLEKIDEPEPGMELCYECEGERVCIMCQGTGTLGGRRCVSCGGARRCIVCRGAGQLPMGTYKRLVDEGLIKE
jgi:hypothetical protein